jgi:serine/threonine protein kinase
MSGQNDQENAGEEPAFDPTSKGMSPPSETPGFDGLAIEREIDRGGMGIVYEALDESLGRKVALKVISPGLANDPVFRTRFIAESKAVASLDNPHILPIYRAGEEDGQLFILTKLIAGGNLGEALQEKGRFTPEETARVITQLGEALEEAHGKGLIHRDIKPANVLVDRSGTKPNYLLTDFGLTRKASEETGITKTGEVLGTVGYMAPEQIEGHTVDRRADVYALGCLAAELLSGAPPFAKETKRATLLAHLYDNPTLPTDIKVPDEEGVNQVLLRAMAKDPDDRYRSSADFAHDLSTSLGQVRTPAASSQASRSIQSRDPGRLKKTLRWTGRIVATIAIGLLLWDLSSALGNPFTRGLFQFWVSEYLGTRQIENETKSASGEHWKALVNGNINGSCEPLSLRAGNAIRRLAASGDPNFEPISYCKEAMRNTRLDLVSPAFGVVIRDSRRGDPSSPREYAAEARLASPSSVWNAYNVKNPFGEGNSQLRGSQRIAVYFSGVSPKYLLVKENGQWRVDRIAITNRITFPDSWPEFKK